MELNNNSATIGVPQDIKDAIENYKNQATLLGLEVERLRKLKAQIEISVSNLTSAEVSKIEKNRQYEEKLNKQKEQVEEFERKKAEILKERIELDQKKFEENKKIEEREAIIRGKEIELNNRKASQDSKQKTIDALEIKYLAESKALEEKKALIAELIKKL